MASAPPILSRLPAPSRARLVAVLAGSGAIGFFLGAFRYPAWQDAIEPAQVLAGLVRYPADAPVYVYATRVWTVLHQVLAVALSWGASERTLTVVVSGVMGMVSFQALAVLILVLSGEVALAALSPVFILVTRATTGGVTYPVNLMGVGPTYGTIGLSYLLLAIAVIGAGEIPLAALLVGFAPAVHLTIGFWAIVVATIALAITPAGRRSLRKGFPYFGAGLTAAAALALLHVLSTDPRPMRASASALGQHWGASFEPFPLLSARAVTTYFSVALPALWLWRHRDEVPEHVRDLLRTLVVAAVLGGTLSVVYWLVPADTPSVIAALMPSRLLSLHVLGCMALLIGLSASRRGNLAIQVNLFVLIVGLIALSIVARLSHDARGDMIFPWTAIGVSGTTLLVMAWIDHDRELPAARMWQIIRLTRATIGMLAGLLLALVFLGSRSAQDEFLDKADAPVLKAVAGRPGLLLTSGDMHLIQGRTRRAILLDGQALDAMLYVPEAEPAVERILRDVYGTELAALKANRQGALADDTGKAIWEARSPADWARLGHEFAFTDVLTYAGWRLQLPVVASSPGFVLYAIADAR